MWKSEFMLMSTTTFPCPAAIPTICFQNTAQVPAHLPPALTHLDLGAFASIRQPINQRFCCFLHA